MEQDLYDNANMESLANVQDFHMPNLQARKGESTMNRAGASTLRVLCIDVHGDEVLLSRRKECPLNDCNNDACMQHEGC